MEIRPLVGAEAGEDELRQWYELFVANRAADFPDFPMMTFESFAEQRRRPRHLELGRRCAWAAREGGRLLGVGTVVYLEDEYADWAVPQVDVFPAHRRRGIGTALLREIVADVRAADGHRTLVQEQVRLGSDGELWARASGFAETLRNSWQMLVVGQTDPALWLLPTPAGFRLEQWAGAAPEHLVAAFAAARNAIGDAPSGESAYAAPEWTVERVRATEAAALEAGDDVRFVVAVHEQSGEVAALTGLLLRPPRVDLCWQRDTAVGPRHRGLGLGRVVKAAMMRALVAEHPGLGRVVTNTAAENAAMIRVNERIGYVRYAEIGMFEADVDRVAAALGGAQVPGPRHEAVPQSVGAWATVDEPEPLGAS